jgi:osmotically-inducible protein OsmY
LLEDAQLNSSRLAVNVKNGAVVLWGDVPSGQAYLAAERIARRQRGVVEVINNLRIVPQEDPVPVA